MCLQAQRHYFVDIRLLFDLRWTTSCYLDAMSFIIMAFWGKSGIALNYIDDFRGVATDEQTSFQHFDMLCSLLKHLCLKEAVHKTLAPVQAMNWLGLHFNTVDMSVSIH